MQPSILIASPDPKFAEPLLGNLKATGDYHVRWVQNGRDALNLLSRLSFDVFILDSNLSDFPTPTLRNMILEISPDQHILEYRGWQGIEAEAIDTQEPRTGSQDALIHSLAEYLDRDPGELSQLPAQSAAVRPIETAGSTWLQDRNRSAQILVSFLMETNAHAAMLVWQGEVFASAGDLEKPMLDEILNLVSRDWNGGARVDLTRFIRFGDGTRYCLYASPLEESILVIVQDLSVPFSQVRMQAAQLGYVLSELPELSVNCQVVEENIPREADILPESEEPGMLVAINVDKLEFSGKDELEPEFETDFVLDEAKAVSLSELFSSMPPPNPENDELDAKPEIGQAAPPQTTNADEAADVEEVRLPLDTYEADNPPEILCSAPVDGASTLELIHSFDSIEVPASIDDQASMDTTQQVITRLVVEELAETVASEPPALKHERKESTRQEFEHEIVFNRLGYTCVLIPRLPKHTLNGELAEKLKQWVPALCLAYGWRLARLALQPEYLMWSVWVEPTESPSRMVRLLRQHTSQRLFSVFNHMRQQNPSGDFWAPGFLVIAGLEPPAPQWMKAFIGQTRTRQGIAPPENPA